MRRILPLLPLLALLATACGGSSSETTTPSSGTDAGLPPTDSSSASDLGPQADTSSPTDSASPPSEAAVDAASDGPCATCATLTGKVLRKPLTKPQHGGKGNVYVAVFDSDPVTNSASAKLVAQTLIPDADMTSDTASVPYTVAGIPTRAEAYSVIAFLDDDHDASGTSPGPNKGDLVSLDGLAAPKVTLSTPTSTTLDLPLSAAMPF